MIRWHWVGYYNDLCYYVFLQKDESIDEAVNSTSYPRLVGCGDLLHLDPFAIAAEGNIVTKLSGVTIGVPLAVALLLSIFYILNIEYTPGVSNVYVLCISWSNHA